MERLDADIKTIARSIIQGNEKRKKRIRTGRASAFDEKTAAIVEDALRASWGISRASRPGGRCRIRYTRALYITHRMNT